MRYLLYSVFVLSIFFSTTSAQDQLSLSHAERLYEQANELLIHSNYGAAREAFSKFLAVSPSNDQRRTEAEYNVAFSALNLGNQDGEKLIENFILNHPSSPKAATAYFDLGNYFYKEGNYKKSVAYFEQVDYPALTRDQQNEAHFKQGYSLFAQRKLDDALTHFNLVKDQSGPYTSASNYYAGFIAFNNGDYDEALADLKKAEANPSYANVVPYLITSIYYRQKKFDEVIRYAEQAKAEPSLANAEEIALLVAESYFYKGDYQKAVPAYQQYFDVKQNADGGALFRAGYANYVAGDAAKGIAYLDKAAASKDTTSYYASYYLGILHLKQGNKPLAINAFDHARNNPADKKLAEESAFQFAKVCFDVGNASRAIEAFEKFLIAYPKSVHQDEAREFLVQAYVNGNDYNRALLYIEKLPARNAAMSKAYQKAAYLKGVEHFNKTEYPRAVEYFLKSLENPVEKKYTAQAALWIAEAYSIGRKYDQALPYYEQAVQHAGDPDVIEQAYYGWGYALYNQQQYSKALPKFQAVVKSGKGPNYSDALLRLADCYYAGKQYSEALNTYGLASAKGKSEGDYILLQKGTIAGIQRKYSEARNYFNDLLKSYPRSTYRDEALYQQAQFEIEQGNYSQAIDRLTQLVREGASSPLLPYAFLRRGSSYFNLKDYNKTVADYLALIQQFPSHPASQEAILPLQEALNLAGRSGEFSRHLADFKKANPGNKELETIEFETAKNLYFDQQYKKAVTALNTYLTEYVGNAKEEEARYYLAESHYRLKEYDKALQIYRMLANNPSSSFQTKVIARMAEINFQQGRYADAIKNFSSLEQLVTNKKEQSLAWTGLMDAYFALGKYDSSEVFARRIIQSGSVSAGAKNKALLTMGKSAMAKGDFESAKDEFIETINTARDENGAEATYLLGEIFYLQKDYKQSYETLIGLNKNFAAYELWVGKSFLLLADNFIAQDDLFQASHTLQSLIDNFPLESIKSQAREKLHNLERMQQDKRKLEELDSLQN